MQTYAQALSVEIETKASETPFGTDYGCTVLATNRVYDETGEALFATGVLALEITVQQIVYITGELSEYQTNNILESGFNRGDGGRIKFRALLQEHGAFAKLINVEVIDGPVAPVQPIAGDVAPPHSEEVPDGPTSPTVSADVLPLPSLPPSVEPSTTTGMSSHAPSASPIGLSSDLPSNSPSTSGLRAEEYNSPTMEPTTDAQEVARPASSGEVADSTTELPRNAFNRRQPLILGAIVGGVATIFVSCFFIFCVWFPFCGNKKRRLPRPPTYERSDPASSASSTDLYGDTSVPGTLHLDRDSRSFANATVTSGEKRRRDRAATTESFDESSIYTSTFSTGVTDNERFQASPIISATELFVDARVGIQEEDPNEVISTFEVESSVGSASSLMAGHLTHDGLEEAKEELDFATRSTKGFDPFLDDSDSSFGLGGSLAASDPSFGTAMNDISKYSPSSMKTKRMDNLVLRVEANVVDGSIEVEEGKEDGNSILENSDIYESSQHSRQSSISDIASSTSLANNALLRSVLENARRRERSSGSSRVSLKSAPSRVTRLQEPKRRTVRLVDHLSSDQVRSNGRGASSRSIGVRSLVSFSEAKQSKRSGHNSYKGESPGLPQYNHASFGSPELASPFGSYASADYDSGKHTLASSDIGTTATPRLRQGSWDGVEEKADSRISSPGVLGIASISDGTPSDIEGMPDIDRLSYPWLFEGDNEHVGSTRHERTNSMSSNWSARSHISGGSVSTDSVQDWTPKKSNSGRPPRPHGPSDDHKLTKRGGSSTSRTLEHDLSKLRDVPGYRRSGARTVISTASAPSKSSVKSAPHRHKEKKQRLQVVAPPGKIGVVLSNRLDGRGTYISEVRPSSTLRHYVRPGDKLGKMDCRLPAHIGILTFCFTQSRSMAKTYPLFPLTTSPALCSQNRPLNVI